MDGPDQCPSSEGTQETAEATAWEFPKRVRFRLDYCLHVQRTSVSRRRSQGGGQGGQSHPQSLLRFATTAARRLNFFNTNIDNLNTQSLDFKTI